MDLSMYNCIYWVTPLNVFGWRMSATGNTTKLVHVCRCRFFGFANGQTFVAATLDLWHDRQRCYRKLSLSWKLCSLSHKTPFSALHSSLRSCSGFCPLCAEANFQPDWPTCRVPAFSDWPAVGPLGPRYWPGISKGPWYGFVKRVQPVKVAGRSAERVGKHCGQLTRFWVQTSGYFCSRKWRVTHSPCQNWPTSFYFILFLFFFPPQSCPRPGFEWRPWWRQLSSVLWI